MSAVKMPVARPKLTCDEYTAVQMLFDAWLRLKALGWQEPRYFRFPPDGEEFELIELGSTGIHRAVRRQGYFWVDGEWPSHPFLVRLAEQAGREK